MNLASLVSGGKDSIYAAYLMQKQGHKIKYILSMRPERTDSYMFHHPNVHLVGEQAKLMDIPLIVGKTRGEKEKELLDLEALISQVKGKVDGITTGALASEYQKKRIDDICKRLGIKSIAPLWHIDVEKYWGELLENKFAVMITAVAAEGLGEEWLGRSIDKKALVELKKVRDKYKIHLGGEGGEFETLVLDCPMFSKKIEVVRARKDWKNDSGSYIIDEIRLAAKR